jgi:hypothetical protein
MAVLPATVLSGFRVLPSRTDFWQESQDGLLHRIRYHTAKGGRSTHHRPSSSRKARSQVARCLLSLEKPLFNLPTAIKIVSMWDTGGGPEGR